MNTKPTTFVLTVDAARARIFKVEGASPRGLPQLAELSSLVNPDARVPDAQRFTDSNPTGSMGPNGTYHSYDDHRSGHTREERKRFAKTIASTFASLVTPPTNAVVCVPHSMHALLSEALERHCTNVNSTLHTLECTMLKPHDLTAMLTDKGLLRRTLDV